MWVDVLLSNRKHMEIIASIVSVGNWNPAIFTPQWVMDNVFRLPEGESIQVNLNEKLMTLTFFWDDIAFSVTDSRLEFKTNKVGAERLVAMDTLFRNLSEMLPYTPITALGYNYNLIGTPEEIASLLPWSLGSFPQMNDYDLSSTVFSTAIGEGQSNINIRCGKEKFEIACNLQYMQLGSLPQDTLPFSIIKTEIQKLFGYVDGE